MNTAPPVPAGVGGGVLPAQEPGAPGRLLPARCCFPAVRTAARLYSLAAAMNRPAGLPEEAR